MARSVPHTSFVQAVVLAVLIAAWLGSHLGAADVEAKEFVSIEVRLVDGEGKPVEGAEVGTSAFIGSGERFRAKAAEQGNEWQYANHSRSGADGVAHLSAEPKFFGDWSSLVARHEARKIAGIASVDLKKLDEPICITLLPEREIVGEAVCPELSPKPLDGINVWILQVDNPKGLIRRSFREPRFRISVPPGTYTIAIHSNTTYWTKQEIVVTPGPGEQRIEPIALQLTALERLAGKPAPEIPGVVAWKNSEPLKLANLRGKVVLLDFWGCWCKPCIQGMPRIFELYDTFHDQGLEVIGIHVDSGDVEEEPVDTAAKLDRRLSEIRKARWSGRDIPFPVALILGKRQSITLGEDVVDRANSPASALFGAGPFPTYILIDRQGNVVGSFNPNPRGPGIALLEKALAEK